MIFTKLRLLVALVLCCIAWNADAACNRANAHGHMVTTWSTYLPKPIARYLEFYLDFDGYKCSISQSYGPGDFMKKWSAASKDGRCLMMIDIQSNEVMIRLDGLIHLTTIEAQVIEENNMQQLWYPKIEFSKGC
jgi:hypothetical protein